jgi:hypothetical protein
MAALSARDIAALEKARVDVKKETYRAILEQFSRKIRNSYELGRKEALVTIPPFVIGFPKYDLAKAVVYMARQLGKLGYQVEMVGPLDLKVRWNVAPAHRHEEEEIDTGPELPGLVNLQKTAQNIRLRITKHK